MASTYSTNLRLELITTGEQQGTWGSTTNKNLGSLLEQAVSGWQDIAVDNTGVSETTLVMTDGELSTARNMIVELSGAITATRNVICPTNKKVYIVRNSTTGGFPVTFKVAGQTGVSVPFGQTVIVYVDGTDARQASLPVSRTNTTQISSIELGAASDTTITRSAPGVIAVEGVTVPLNSVTNTHTALQYEVGAASDTTITRSSAGVIAVEGVTVPLNSTTSTHTALQYEVGNASDTTISRSSAGIIAVEGVTVPLNSITNTHTALQYEVGNASDTTITRSSAGVIAVEGGIVPKENRTNTFSSSQTFSGGLAVSGGSALVTGSGGLGYGTGSGGAVTQLTSKLTTVTLNKTSGQITTSNSALAANSSAIFLFQNSFISPTDTIILNLIVPSDVRYNSNVYDVKVDVAENGGAAYITVKNLSTTTSYSDALLLNFAVIKGATS